MNGIEALQSVQYVTAQGKRFAVLDIEDWEIFIEWLETVEDIQIAKQAFATLKAVNNNRQQAGWLEWEKVKKELE